MPTCSPKTTLACRAAAAILLVVLSGCAGLDLGDNFNWPDFDPQAKLPDRVTDLWTDAVLHQPGRPGVRGFGGRVMFYTKGDEKPIRVEGKLAVFAFDATSEDAAETLPEKKFVFMPEQLQNHYSESELGHSYSFWLPWDEVGGPQRRVSLICRFEGSDGGLVMSQGSIHTLPGIPPGQGNSYQSPIVQHYSAARGTVQQVSYEEPVKGPPKEKGMTTATIDVPPSFVARSFVAPPSQPVTERAVGSVVAAADVSNPQKPPPSSGPSRPEADRPEDSAEQVAAEPSPSARFARRRYPARRGPIAGPRYDPVRRQPHPATWPSGLPTTPRSGWSDVWRQTRSGGEPAPNGWPPATAE